MSQLSCCGRKTSNDWIMTRLIFHHLNFHPFRQNIGTPNERSISRITKYKYSFKHQESISKMFKQIRIHFFFHKKIKTMNQSCLFLCSWIFCLTIWFVQNNDLKISILSCMQYIYIGLSVRRWWILMFTKKK